MELHDKKYRIGIALSGGGARGFAHAGALKAIEEAGIKPDIIAGVSAGSVISVLYAAGVKPDDMPKMFHGGKFSDFASFNGRGSLFQINRFKKFILKNLNGYKRLEDLPIPTYLGLTDLDNGIPAEFHEGEIGDIMMASCSIPIVFPPVNIGGTRYVDGGVLHNLPAWIIRDKCDYLIGINCSPLPSDNGGSGIIDIALRTFSLMSKCNQAPDMEMCDTVVELRDIAHYKVFNLKDIQKVFISGYAATRRALKNLPPYLLSNDKTHNISVDSASVEQH
ncbi:MAG: patatin-like phospholipase family protein [Muribaculaceae bacterium]|nr:patatin-like phospholipase family protein [Muribaculaceae bacterium]